jgi:hypothetical protein
MLIYGQQFLLSSVQQIHLSDFVDFKHQKVWRAYSGKIDLIYLAGDVPENI